MANSSPTVTSPRWCASAVGIDVYIGAAATLTFRDLAESRRCNWLRIRERLVGQGFYP